MQIQTTSGRGSSRSSAAMASLLLGATVFCASSEPVNVFSLRIGQANHLAVRSDASSSDTAPPPYTNDTMTIQVVDSLGGSYRVLESYNDDTLALYTLGLVGDSVVQTYIPPYDMGLIRWRMLSSRAAADTFDCVGYWRTMWEQQGYDSLYFAHPFNLQNDLWWALKAQTPGNGRYMFGYVDSFPLPTGATVRANVFYDTYGLAADRPAHGFVYNDSLGVIFAWTWSWGFTAFESVSPVQSTLRSGSAHRAAARSGPTGVRRVVDLRGRELHGMDRSSGRVATSCPAWTADGAVVRIHVP